MEVLQSIFEINLKEIEDFSSKAATAKLGLVLKK
jgi:hypothetical protein